MTKEGSVIPLAGWRVLRCHYLLKELKNINQINHAAICDHYVTYHEW